MGLQKLTLLDYPGKVACTVFAGGCNFRCPFCHNSDLVLNPDEELPAEEFFSFLKKRTGVLDGVCVSGGEPLMYDGAEDFIAEIKKMGFSVKVDTNGSFPARLKSLVEKNLVDYVAMDIKNSPEKYSLTAGAPKLDFSKVEESVNFLMSGAVPFEFRTTVVKEFHEPEDFEKIGSWLKGSERYFLQGFIDSGRILGKNLHAHTPEEMKVFLSILAKNIPNAQIRGQE